MAYQILEEGTHKCDKPDPKMFLPGTVIECTDVVLKRGKKKICGIEWLRIEGFWWGQAQWQERDYSW